MKKIFVSYDYDNDRNYKNILLAWDKNKDFNFSFRDNSTDVSIDSSDPAVIKRVISSRINESDILLCLIGENTKNSSWVKWEIEKAIELNKKIVAVKIKKEFESPSEIQNIDAKWAMSFTFEAIKKAIDELSKPSLTINQGAPRNPSKPPSPPWSF